VQSTLVDLSQPWTFWISVRSVGLSIAALIVAVVR
jgi:hypothetical protein